MKRIAKHGELSVRAGLIDLLHASRVMRFVTPLLAPSSVHMLIDEREVQIGPDLYLRREQVPRVGPNSDMVRLGEEDHVDSTQQAKGIAVRIGAGRRGVVSAIADLAAIAVFRVARGRLTAGSTYLAVDVIGIFRYSDGSVCGSAFVLADRDWGVVETHFRSLDIPVLYLGDVRRALTMPISTGHECLRRAASVEHISTDDEGE